MPTRKCVKCGAPFERRYEDQFLCEACAAKSKANFAVKLKDRTCRTCGTTFKGDPRAWYCPTCRAERERASRRKRIAQQIRDMCDRGVKNADIAQALNISVATVRTYEPYNTTTKTIKASRK